MPPGADGDRHELTLGGTFPVGQETWRFVDVHFDDRSRWRVTVRRVGGDGPPEAPRGQVWEPARLRPYGHLDEARLVTYRTIIGQVGYFVTRGRLMASPGSDFAQIMNGQVMDRACVIARAAYLLYLNKDVRIDGEMVQHLPILREIWVISLHGLVQTTLDDDDTVPYFLLPSLGSGSTLRA